MASSDYIHGYDEREQDRLIAQAEFWRDLIPDGLALRPGDRLLDIGCGVGAVLGVLGRTFPGTALAGIDLEPAQIARAAEHLRSLGLQADLRTGDAAKLPWPDGSFDHVYIMWLLEHLRDAAPVLAEARRVLRPGGRITITETDYNAVIHPENADFTVLMEAWRALFRARGNAHIARTLGPMLHRAGFVEVSNRLAGIHHFAAPGDGTLRRTTHYIADFMEPECAAMAALGWDEPTLRRGIRALRTLADHDDAAITGTIYRATGLRGR